MKPLLFILIVTGFSIKISHYLSAEVTWFTYYLGGMTGFILSAICIEIWNKKRRKKEEIEAKSIQKIYLSSP